MRLKWNQFEVEGKDKIEIEWVLERVKTLASEFKTNNGGDGAGRGRKLSFIKFPKGRFTIQELADKLEISSACIYQRLLKMEAVGDAKRDGEVRKPGSRGKATAYWKVINFPIEETEERTKSEKFDVNLDEIPD